MRPSIHSVIKAATLGLGLLALSSSAIDYSVWINGRGEGGTPGVHTDFRYWGPAPVSTDVRGNTNAGVNPKSANWDGYSRIASQNFRVRDALDCYCTGNNWCYVAAYSAGDLMIGYALDLYGGSKRYKKDAVPNASGQCTNTDGRKQTGWNIRWVRVAAGAAGGTELADAGAWAVTEPLVSDLKTSTARAMYNHDNTRGSKFFMYAGAKGGLYSALLPGQDDEVVAYHSSAGVSGTGAYCNPGDWFCKDVTVATKWANHSLWFLDVGEDYNHYLNGSWGGIVAPMKADMASYATSPN